MAYRGDIRAIFSKISIFKFQIRSVALLTHLWINSQKVSVSKVATLAGLSRANIYANYKDLFDKTAPIKDKARYKEHRKVLQEKESTLHTLRQEKSLLKEANLKLMDELVAMKILLENCNKLT